MTLPAPLRPSAAAVLLLLAVSSPAAARPGFLFVVGAGGTEVAGQTVAVSRVTDLTIEGLPDLSTDHGDGISGFARLGFNLLGYGAVEIDVAANAQNLDAGPVAFALHGRIGARLYPLWHWQGLLPALLQPFEPSIFLGAGLSYQIYQPTLPAEIPASVSAGWRKLGTFCFGLGLEYFLFSVLRLGLEYNLDFAAIDVFLFSFEDGIRSRLEVPANTAFHAVQLSVGIQFDPFGQPTPFDQLDGSPGSELDAGDGAGDAAGPAGTAKPKSETRDPTAADGDAGVQKEPAVQFEVDPESGRPVEPETVPDLESPNDPEPATGENDTIDI